MLCYSIIFPSLLVLLFITPPVKSFDLCVGQDYGSMQRYLEHFPAPPLTMSYMNLTFHGLTSPTSYGSGVQWAEGASALSSSGAVAIGLDLGGVSGLSSLLSQPSPPSLSPLLNFLRSPSRNGSLLRIGYEFDNPQFGYTSSPGLYRSAFSSVSSSLPSGVGAVWHTWARSASPDHLADFYPWDDEAAVDKVGVSIFRHPYREAGEESMESLDAVLAFARGVGKRVVVAESTPFGGYDERWIRTVRDWIRRNDDIVDVWCYIDCDWDGFAQWRGVGFGDTRIWENGGAELWEEVVEEAGGDTGGWEIPSNVGWGVAAAGFAAGAVVFFVVVGGGKWRKRKGYVKLGAGEDEQQ